MKIQILLFSSFLFSLHAMDNHLSFKESVGQDDNSNCTLLNAAVRTGDIDKIKLLLAHNANINQKNSCGNTALHEAVDSYFQTKTSIVVDFLIKKNADINIQNIEQETPLHVACRMPFGFGYESAKLLLLAKANRSIKNNKGRTAQEEAQFWLNYWEEAAQMDPIEYNDADNFEKLVNLFKEYPEKQ